MRLLARLALVTAVAALPAAIALASCGTDAEGPDACRQIEEARCALAPTCSPGFDVQKCDLFYRDECLVGLQNTTIGEPDNATVVQPCVTALDEITACAAGIDGGDGGCPGLGILVEMDASCNGPDGGPIEVTPCNVLLNCPEVLYACAFIAAVPGADAGDAATGTGGSPVFTTATSSTSATGTGGAASTSSTAASTTSTGTGGATTGTGGSGTGGMDAGDASPD